MSQLPKSTALLTTTSCLNRFLVICYHLNWLFPWQLNQISLSLWFVTILQNILTNRVQYSTSRALKNSNSRPFPWPALHNGSEESVIYCILWRSHSSPYPTHTVDRSLLKSRNDKLIPCREWAPWRVGPGQEWAGAYLKNIAYRLLKELLLLCENTPCSTQSWILLSNLFTKEPP